MWWCLGLHVVVVEAGSRLCVGCGGGWVGVVAVGVCDGAGCRGYSAGSPGDSGGGGVVIVVVVVVGGVATEVVAIDANIVIFVIFEGNSAFETADHIISATNLIHMVGRSRVRLAWATHYVGDLRYITSLNSCVAPRL